MKSRPRLDGFLYLHGETGYEGPPWAFQDKKYIRKNVGFGFCEKCGKPLESECSKGRHEESVGESWDYEGLYILKDGDKLTVFNKDDPSKIIWQGIVKMYGNRYLEFGAFDYLIWRMWFAKKYPASLIPLNGRK